MNGSHHGGASTRTIEIDAGVRAWYERSNAVVKMPMLRWPGGKR